MKVTVILDYEDADGERYGGKTTYVMSSQDTEVAIDIETLLCALGPGEVPEKTMRMRLSGDIESVAQQEIEP